MKIALYSPYLPKHAGGGEKYLFDCAKVLVEEGHDVSIAISNNEELLNEEAEAIIRAKYENFLNYSLKKIKFICSPLFTKANFFKKLFWTAQFDVLYYQTDGSLFFSLAKKNILHIQIPLKLDKSSLLEKIKLMNWSIKNTNSQFTKTYIEKFWQTKINYIHQPYVNTQEFASATSNRQEKEKIILSVGRFFCQLHSKRQDVLVDFFKSLVELDTKALQGWKLVLLGHKEDETFAKKVEKMAYKLNIKILYEADRQTLIKYYQKASIYWHAAGFEINEEKYPEKVEHFGIATLEAMAAQVVPIVINKGGQKEILGEVLAECLWQDKNDCLVKTLELIKNKQKREKLAFFARERSLLFSKEKFKNILLTMIGDRRL
jgi:glycosyltransferase involved in cell wall biosynthesis